MTATATATKPSALDAFRALGKKPTTPAGQILPPGLTDPAIIGAKRDKNTVKLGLDPVVTERAKYAADLAQILAEAEADFTMLQAEMRDYGRDKRTLYNDYFKAGVTTVCIPYTVEVPADAESATPGRETRYIQVVCTNRYSISQEMILNNQDKFGDTFARLFEVNTTKTLKPNAEDLIRNLLTEAGMTPDEVNVAMESLLDTKTSIKTTAGYEMESKAVTDTGLRAILEQAVTRVQPALKFPDLG
jgi:hypothetical protein